MNIFNNLILGNFSLAKTFWIFYFLPSLLFNALVLYRQGNYPNLPISIFLLIYAVPIIYRILSIVAVWNSSGKYKGKKIWFYLVRFIIAVNVAEIVCTWLKFIMFYVITRP